ncbi:hypothetical protein BGX24_009395 [Mortierella sp. AD032]|nr:hypothetical protein BGX24_009395 [Mortierella sp. AD032]
MQRYRPFSKATWNIYLGFLAFRIFISFSPGYIHPDEFFQSAEITAGGAITTGIPYLLLKAIVGTHPDHFVSSRALFITQRLAFFLISLIIGK